MTDALVVIMSLLLISNLLVVVCCTVSHAASLREDDRLTDDEKVCLSPRCVLQSASILTSMDTSIDPCEDFYGYACGRWSRHQRIPEGSGSWNNFFEVFTQSLDVVIEKLATDEADINGRKSEAVVKAKRLFASCVNETFSNGEATIELFKILTELGGWELVDGLVISSNHSNVNNNDNVNLSIPRLVASVHKMASFPLFGIAVTPDDKNSSRNILAVFQGGLGMGLEDYYLNNDTREEDAYIEFGLKVISLLRWERMQRAPYDVGAIVNDFLFDDVFADEDNDTDFLFDEVIVDEGNNSVSSLAALERLAEITEFEVEIAEAFVPDKETRNPAKLYHKMTVDEFAKTIPEFDFSEYFSELFGEEIQLDEEILVYTPSYFHRLNSIIRDTKQDIIRSYAVWYLVQDLIFYLGPPYRLAIMDFLESLQGYTTVTPLHNTQQCAELTATEMTMVTGAIYVENFSARVTKMTQTQIENIINNIRRQFLELIPSMDWMNNTTRESAKRKAVAMGMKISHPPWILDVDELDRLYQNHSLMSDVLLENVMEIRHLDVNQMLRRRGTNVDETLWLMNPLEPNAYYEQSRNEIVFPAGILRPPFFDPALPRSMQYGAIGTIIGHELIHGFDASGRHYDEVGNLNDWWDAEAEAAYRAKAHCLESQYESYPLGKLHPDGMRTLNENIADNGGLHLALAAYRDWRQDHEDQEFSLPGFQNWTSEQMFFLSSAQMWCDVTAKDVAKLEILTDEHSLAKFRVLGPFSNLPEFAEAFSCPVGSRMNPEQRCRVW